jgi:hypothetical protein
VIIAVDGPANSLDFYGATNGSATWHPETVAGPGTTYSAPAVIGNDGSANVVAEGPNNTLTCYWQENGDNLWNPEPVQGSELEGQPVITTESFDGTDMVDIVAQGPVFGLESYVQVNTSGVWVFGNVYGSGIATSAPAVTVNNSPRQR